MKQQYLDYIHEYKKYKKYNKIISHELHIKRDVSIEKYLHNNMSFFYKYSLYPAKFENIRLKKWEYVRQRSKSFMAYYSDKDLNFNKLNYIVCRIVVSYLVNLDSDILRKEVLNIDNCFYRAYVANKINELLTFSFREKFIQQPIAIAE